MLLRTPLFFLASVVASVALGRLGEAVCLPQGGRWTSGGTESGAGFSSLGSPHSKPQEAWTQRLTGKLESEPLVWDQNLLLSLKDRSGRRSLVWMDLASGRRLASQNLVSTSAFQPAIWGDRVAIRVDGNRIDILRILGARFQPLRTIGGKELVSAPLLAEGRLFLREGDALRAYSLDRNEALWSLAGQGKFRGRPSFVDGVLFALAYDKEGRAILELIDARNVHALGALQCGDHGGTIPAQDAKLDVTVLGGDAFVQFPLGVHGSGEKLFRTARIKLLETLAGPRLDPEAGVRLYPLGEPALGIEQGWLGLTESQGQPDQWIVGKSSDAASGDTASNHRTSIDPVRGVVLAERKLHPNLLATPARPAVAGDVALIGNVAADTSSWEILWRLAFLPRVRPVPCEPAPGQVGWLVAPSEDQLSLLWTRDRSESRAQATVEGLLLDLEQREADSLAQLAQRALQSGSPDLVERLVREAVERGAKTTGTTGRALNLAQDGLARLLSTGTQRVNPRNVEALAKEEQHIFERLPDELARAALDAGDLALRRALLGALLERDPGHPRAAQATRALLPPDAPMGSSFDPASWLVFLNATATHPVTFERPGTGVRGNLVSERLNREAKQWRPDLVAYSSARLSVIAAPEHPGAVARALAVGELVCDVLEQLMPSRGESEQEPLILLLYESEAEYRSQSTRDGSAPEVTRGWTVGHYDPRDNLSRMFVPPGDKDNRRLLGTFAHELTHHWLATRSPFAETARRAKGGRNRAGFWLVEGVANLVGELSFDSRNGSWSSDNPRADSLDGLANTDPRDLIGWERLLHLSKNGFDGLSIDRNMTVPLTWQLGAASQRSQLNLFYDQAGALAHYLFAADNGSHAAVLFDALRAYYTDSQPVDIPTRLGMEAEDLGRLVIEHAKAVVQGG